MFSVSRARCSRSLAKGTVTAASSLSTGTPSVLARKVFNKTPTTSPGWLRIQSTRGFATVPLVYDHHAPAKPSVRDEKDSPILFLHGLFGSKKNNRSISKVLARDLGRHVFALDLRNHGESPHDQRHDYSSMAADVLDFISQHGLEQPTLIGHSMGAKTAMVVALQKPEAVANIISVDNAPVDARIQGNFARYVKAMKRIDEAGVTRQAEADKILAEYEKSLPIRQFLLGNLHRPATNGNGNEAGSTPSNVQKFRVPLNILGKALDHMGDFPFKDPSTVRFEKPALFIRGTKSHYVPDEVIPIIGQFFPRFEMVDVDAGHWLISENPEAFRQAVVRFLEPKE